jgi:hypothetical protein
MYPGDFVTVANTGRALTASARLNGKDPQRGVLAVLCKEPTGFGLNDVPPGVLRKSAEEVGKRGRRERQLSGISTQNARSAKGTDGMSEIVLVVTEVHFESAREFE